MALLDQPPYGFRYVPLSGTLNGETIADPIPNNAGELTFSLAELEAGQTVNVTYSLRVTAAAVDSDGVNEVIAVAVTDENAQVESPVSRARTSITRYGVLSDRASLFGKVYVDQNCNDLQDNGEWPVGGVRLFMEDGTCLLYTSPSPRDLSTSRMPSSA